MNYSLSPKIFNELMNGRAINKYIPEESGRMVENRLYSELTSSIEEYIEIQKANGFDLVSIGDAFFIRERGQQSYDENAMNAMVIIDCLYKGVINIGFNPTILKDPDLGLPMSKLSDIQKIPEIALVLKSCGFKADIEDSIKKSLINRRLAYIRSNEYLFLSDAGKALVNELHDSETTSAGLIGGYEG